MLLLDGRLLDHLLDLRFESQFSLLLLGVNGFLISDLFVSPLYPLLVSLVHHLALRTRQGRFLSHRPAQMWGIFFIEPLGEA